MKIGSLAVVGTGIQAIRHTTLETLYELQHADKLFYLVADTVAEEWLRELNSTAESLASDYAEGVSRQKTYDRWVERILDHVRSGLRVCAAFYGHPGVFVCSGHEAIRQAKQEGYSATMLPAISAEDCLFADLGVDPRYGCQSFEATSFLLSEHQIDVSSSLILWQIGILGQLDYRKPFSNKGIPLLAETLQSYFGDSHIVTVYEASMYPICEPRIDSVPLSQLTKVEIGPRTTLYIPPLHKPEFNEEFAKSLKAAVLDNSQ